MVRERKREGERGAIIYKQHPQHNTHIHIHIHIHTHKRDPQKLDVPLTSIKGHESIVNCMSSLNQTISEIATGSRDGCVKVWDTRQPEKAVLTIRSNSKKDIWAVAFGKDMYRKDEAIY